MVHAQAPKDIVRQAVQTELKASENDHTHWLYFENNHQEDQNVKQWVAQARSTDLARVIERNGRRLSESEQRQEMESFMNNQKLQAKQRKSGEHDDEQAAELLRMLPDAFVWTNRGEQDGTIHFHFVPDPQFRPPDMEARVFAAMEGDMMVDAAEHRIVSLKGRLMRDLKFGFGILGSLQAGGSFDIERRKTGGSVWQITETHVHMHGHILFFKTISEEQDDVKSKFKQLPPDISMQQAVTELFGQDRPEMSSVRQAKRN
jgi:hypothetical protein